MNWNDLKLFIAVARAEGLSGAALSTGVSSPTLGRRLAAFEQGLGIRLFERKQTGYSLTDKGRALLEKAEAVETAVASIERWRAGADAARTVSIAAGTWTAAYLAGHVTELCRDTDAFRLRLLASETPVDLGRRAADIGIRNRRPDERWLARQKLMTVAFAAYCSVTPHRSGWIGVAGNVTPTAQWLDRHHRAETGLWADTPSGALEMAKAGAGQILLPCFVGDREPELKRNSDLIGELRHDQWLVTHHEQRHDNAVREVMRRIVDRLKQDRDLFSGALGG